MRGLPALRTAGSPLAPLVAVAVLVAGLALADAIGRTAHPVPPIEAWTFAGAVIDDQAGEWLRGSSSAIPSDDAGS